MVVLSWDGIVARFELKFDLVFNLSSSKAVFDSVNHVIDGAKNSWKFIVLLDAVVCHNKRTLNLSTTADQSVAARKFDQHSILRSSIISEYTTELSLQSKDNADSSITLDIDSSWLSVKRIQGKLLDEESSAKNLKSTMKRQLVVQALCNNLTACGDLRQLFESTVREVCLGDPTSSLTTAVATAVTTPATTAAVADTAAAQSKSEPSINENRLKHICTVIYKAIQRTKRALNNDVLLQEKVVKSDEDIHKDVDVENRGLPVDDESKMNIESDEGKAAGADDEVLSEQKIVEAAEVRPAAGVGAEEEAPPASHIDSELSTHSIAFLPAPMALKYAIGRPIHTRNEAYVYEAVNANNDATKRKRTLDEVMLDWDGKEAVNVSEENETRNAESVTAASDGNGFTKESSTEEFLKEVPQDNYEVKIKKEFPEEGKKNTSS